MTDISRFYRIRVGNSKELIVSGASHLVHDDRRISVICIPMLIRQQELSIPLSLAHIRQLQISVENLRTSADQDRASALWMQRYGCWLATLVLVGTGLVAGGAVWLRRRGNNNTAFVASSVSVCAAAFGNLRVCLHWTRAPDRAEAAQIRMDYYTSLLRQLGTVT